MYSEFDDRTWLYFDKKKRGLAETVLSCFVEDPEYLIFVFKFESAISFFFDIKGVLSIVRIYHINHIMVFFVLQEFLLRIPVYFEFSN
jgi:hypothetical protein